MGTAPDAVKRLVDRFDQNRDATDGSQLTAFSPRLDSDSGPSAASRKPIADVLGEVYEQFLGKVIRLTAGHQTKVEERAKVRRAGDLRPASADCMARFTPSNATLEYARSA
jgi:hypothetical protein